MPAKRKRKECPYSGYYWRSDSANWKPKDGLPSFGLACQILVSANFPAQQTQWTPMNPGDTKSKVWYLQRSTFIQGKMSSEIIAIWDANGADDDSVDVNSSPLFVCASIDERYELAAEKRKKISRKNAKKNSGNYVGDGQTWQRQSLYPDRWSGDKLLRVFKSKFPDATLSTDPSPVWNETLQRLYSPPTSSLCIKLLKHDNVMFKWTSSGKIGVSGMSRKNGMLFSHDSVLEFFKKKSRRGR